MAGSDNFLPFFATMPSAESVAAKPLRLALLLYPGCMPAGLFAAADMAREKRLGIWIDPNPPPAGRAAPPIDGGPENGASNGAAQGTSS